MELPSENPKNLFSHIDELWIGPEIERRHKEGVLPEDFKVRQCLILFPKTGFPKAIQFNDEIGWVAETEPVKPYKPGQDVYLHQVKRVINVKPPTIDGKRCAFIYLFYTGVDYSVIFDFSPNWPDFSELTPWTLGKNIADYLNKIFEEKSVRIHEKIKERLQACGLWPAPALLPFPFSAIAKELEENNPDNARQLIVECCTGSFLITIVNRWGNVGILDNRISIIEQALTAHINKSYALSIHALVPQIEGVISDWVYSISPDSLPFRPQSKAKKFRDLILSDLPTTYTYKTIVEAAINFILEGPMQKSFDNWGKAIDTAFPGRHPIAHGKHDPAIFTEENSIKLFLLIDTLIYIINNRPILNNKVVS